MSVYRRTYRRQDGRTRAVWAYDFCLAGRRYARTLGEIPKTMAREYVAQLKASIRRSRYQDPRPAPVPLFRDAAADALRHYRTATSEPSHRRMATARRALSALDGLPLDALTVQTVEAHKTQRAEAGCAPATINLELRFLRLVFRDYPAIPSPMARVAKLPERTPERLLSPAEEGRLLFACHPRLRAVVIVALDTGLRRRDLTSLQAKHVDLARRLITVPGRGSVPGRGAKPKTARARLVGMTDRVADVLASIRPDDPEASVFGYQWSSIDHLFAAAVRRAGIPPLRFHDLRHTFGSRLVQHRVHLEDIRQVMGHAKLATTQRYLHLNDPATAQVVAVLNPPIGHEPPTDSPTGRDGARAAGQKPQVFRGLAASRSRTSEDQFGPLSRVL